MNSRNYAEHQAKEERKEFYLIAGFTNYLTLLNANVVFKNVLMLDVMDVNLKLVLSIANVPEILR